MVLYLFVTAAGPAADVETAIAQAQRRGHEVCVVATPHAYGWLDARRLRDLTGHAVRHDYEGDRLPKAAVVIVAPLTLNTLTKWADGHADNYALTSLIELMGLGLPIVTMPFINSALAAHPAYPRSIAVLRSCGVTVLDRQPHAPGTGDPRSFPWGRLLDAVGG